MIISPSISSASPVPRETIARLGGVWRPLRARRHRALYYASRLMHYSSMAPSDDRPTCSYLRACVSRLVFPSRIGRTGSVTVTKPHHRRARAIVDRYNAHCTLRAHTRGSRDKFCSPRVTTREGGRERKRKRERERERERGRERERERERCD